MFTCPFIFPKESKIIKGAPFDQKLSVHINSHINLLTLLVASSGNCDVTYSGGVFSVILHISIHALQVDTTREPPLKVMSKDAADPLDYICQLYLLFMSNVH